MLDADPLEETGPVPFSTMDWRSRASRRVLHSTFAAEATMAFEAASAAAYLRCYGRTSAAP